MPYTKQQFKDKLVVAVSKEILRYYQVLYPNDPGNVQRDAAVGVIAVNAWNLADAVANKRENVTTSDTIDDACIGFVSVLAGQYRFMFGESGYTPAQIVTAITNVCYELAQGLIDERPNHLG